MVAAGQITAKIDGRTGMVRFADDVGAASGQQQQHGAGGAGLEGWSSVAGVEALDARMRQVLDLSKRLQQANEMVGWGKGGNRSLVLVSVGLYHRSVRCG